MSIHNGPLHKLGIPFIGPWTWIRQAHSTRPVGLYFHPLQLPPSPHWSIILERKDKMGWRFKVHGLTVLMPVGWRFKAHGLTVSVQMLSTVQTSDRLSGRHYGAWHMSFFDWFLSQIEAFLRLPCTSPINTKVYLSHFFIFCWNILSERTHHPCQRLPRSFCYINRWHTHSIKLLHMSSTHFLHSFTKIGKCSLSTSPADTFLILIYFPRLYTPIIIFRSVWVVRFCRLM